MYYYCIVTYWYMFLILQYKLYFRGSLNIDVQTGSGSDQKIRIHNPAMNQEAIDIYYKFVLPDTQKLKLNRPEKKSWVRYDIRKKSDSVPTWYRKRYFFLS